MTTIFFYNCMVVKEYKIVKKFDIKNNVDDKKHIIQFLPESLMNLSNSKFLMFKGKKLKSDYIIDIIHSLLLKFSFKKENSFRLSATILKDKYGYLYNTYVDYLTSNGYIELVYNYQKGKNSRVYKLNDKILSDKVSRYKNMDKVLLKKYKNALSTKGNISYNSILPEIKNKLIDDLYYVKIHYEKAIFFLDSTLQDVSIYNRNKYSVECINDNQVFYHFDSYGRMHTNFTILKSFIRKNCLTINDSETFEVDIKNSQPLFLCKLIERSDSDIDEKELELFRYLTQNGIFYQYIMDNLDIKDRKVAKEMVYKVLFGKNFKNKLDSMFQSMFPSIYLFIKKYKKDNGDYKTLSHTLQNLESNFIFNKVIKELMYFYPEIKLITIHDSIICGIEYKPILERIFNKNLKDEFKR